MSKTGKNYDPSGSLVIRGMEPRPPSGMEPPKWRKQWDQFEPTGDMYGGYMPPKTGNWQMVGMTDRLAYPTIDMGYGISVKNTRMGRFPTGEKVPVWRLRNDSPTSTSSGSYSNSPSPGVAPQELADRRAALDRTQEYTRQVMGQVGQSSNSGGNDSPSSTGASSVSTYKPPVPAPTAPPAGSSAVTAPSFSDMLAYGRSYNDAAAAGRAETTARAQLGIPEVAYATQQMIQGIDPSRVKISETEPFEKQLERLKLLKKLAK